VTRIRVVGRPIFAYWAERYELSPSMLYKPCGMLKVYVPAGACVVVKVNTLFLKSGDMFGLVFQKEHCTTPATQSIASFGIKIG
jgi:hypothetical protein